MRLRRRPPAASAGGWHDAKRRAYLLGLAPAVIVLAGITIVPGLYLVVVSLTPLDLTRPATAWDFSVPWRNYLEAFNDPRFQNSVWVQTKLSVSTVILQLAIGLGIALLLNARSTFIEAVRTAFVIPMVLPPIVVALIWRVIYTPEISPMHRTLEFLGIPVRSLITNPDTALWAIAVADTWEWFPLTFLMILAALQTIPDEPLEAAHVDGASRYQIFLYVMVPYIQPTLVVAGLFRLIDSIKTFPLVYVLTNGGPGSVTEVTNYYGYIQAFTFSYWGYSSAIAMIMMMGIFVLSMTVDRLTEGRTLDD